MSSEDKSQAPDVVSDAADNIQAIDPPRPVGMSGLVNVSPERMRRYREDAFAQVVNRVAETGRREWTDGDGWPPQVSGDLPPGTITFALAERKETAFVFPSEGVMTFREFAETVASEPDIRADKHAGPLITFNHMQGCDRVCVFPSGRVWRPGGVSRSLSSSRGVTCIGLDFDKGDVAVAAVIARLEAHGLEGLVHTTHSNTEAHPRLRCIVPLTKSRWISPDKDGRRAWKAVYLGFAKMIGAGTADPACSDPVRLFYLPAHAPSAPYEYRYVEGEPLDISTVEPFVEPRTRRTYAPEQPHCVRRERSRGYVGSDGPVPASLARIKAALSVVPADCPYPEWRNIVWAVHSAVYGTPDEDAGRQLAEDWSRTAPELFEQDAFDALWEYASADGGITVNTLFHQARKHGYEQHEEEIADAHRLELLGELA